jgi:phage tail sheath protein FI
MSDSFLHGVEVVEIDDGARSITTVKSSVIGLVGSAPIGAINTPVLIHGNIREAVKKFGPPGYGFTIPDALDAIFDQAGAQVVVINVADPADATLKTTVAATSMSFDSSGKIQLPHVAVSGVTLSGPVVAPMTFSDTKLTLPAGATLTKLQDSTGTTAYTATTDYTVSGTTVTQVTAGAMVSGQKALVTYTVTALTEITDYTLDADSGLIAVVSSGKIASKATLSVAYTYLDPTKVKKTAVIGGATGSTYTGVHGLVSARSTVGVTPRILIAPGFTNQMAVVSEMAGVASKLKAVIIADGPNTTDEAAIAYRNNFGSRRVYVVDPWVRVTNPVTDATEDQPPSARVAGLIGLRDNEKGFWWSPSNQEISGISGISRTIDFALGDASSAANTLNENEVATIIYQDGYRLWGNRTCSGDSAWAFLNVGRTADMIEESILAAHLWAVDRNITKAYLEAVVEGVNAYLRYLKARGAIIDGKAWADKELNTASTLAAGQVYIDFDFCPPSPAEHITFQATLNTDYLTEVLS